MPVIAVILALQVGSQPKINEHHWLVGPYASLK